jgi:hypothetical protein
MKYNPTNGQIYDPEDGQTIATMSESATPEQAKLLAAAPALFRALDLLIGAAEQHSMSNDPDIKKELTEARAAIDQATQEPTQ